MVRCSFPFWLVPAMVLLAASAALGQQAGSIRGVVNDGEFDIPLAGTEVQIAETKARVGTTETGNYSFAQVPAGKYTLVFSRSGYNRQVKADVAVTPGQMTELNVSLTGEVMEMDDFVVQDLKLGSGTEEGLLKLRSESPALMDSVSSQLINLAGAGDAAAALRLVSGATVQDGKYAVVRGLPDRYVSSQMNGVRLPTADQNKRAVQLDQFPAAAIESIQVSKTFTPDQQGDASGGAVNVVLKGIPDKPVLQLLTGAAYNTQDPGDGKFITSKGGGVDWLGRLKGQDIPSGFYRPEGGSGIYPGAVGVSRDDEPMPYKWGMTAGGKYELAKGLRIGALANVYYERDVWYRTGGIDDRWWVTRPGAPMTPAYSQGSPASGDFKTSLFDVTQSSEEVKLGGLGVVGLETDTQKLKLLYMGTRDTESTATLAENTRGKQYYYPGYNPNDPTSPGFNQSTGSPWLRYETLSYTERTTDTLQLSGWHKLAAVKYDLGNSARILPPEFDWTVAGSSAGFDEPDKRRFGSQWIPGFTPGSLGQYDQAVDLPSSALGNLNRTWKDITEDSGQFFANLKLPFKQWTQTEGYFKFGVFYDHVKRQYNQDSFSNFFDEGPTYQGAWSDYWSAHFTDQVHKVKPASVDVDYKGDQQISAWYGMADLPLCSWFSVIGGARFENTNLTIVDSPDKGVTWVPPGSTTDVELHPGDADVTFKQNDVLPSLGFALKPVPKWTLRGTYSQTVARQTFKELTPIQQQEYLGSDIFVGNPALQMSALKNYDLRLDYTPYEGSLVSASYFYKDIINPIEYVQRSVNFTYTSPVNYPKGALSGIELEARQKLGRLWRPLEGLTAGANATFIQSQVNLPPDEIARFQSVKAPMTSRDMTNAPAHLFNLYTTYDLERYGTQLGLFYTVKGDTLVAGAGTGAGLLVPSVYEKEYGTLNATVTQKLWGPFKLKFTAKNLTNPKIQTVYRSDFIDSDKLKTSYQKGMEFWMTLSAEW